MIYALTVRVDHKIWSSNPYEILVALQDRWHCNFVQIVKHDNITTGEHYHIACESDMEEIYFKSGDFHFAGAVRNCKAYIKYMMNHDVVGEPLIWGELPYTESDQLVDYLEATSPLATVKKFGWQALRSYSTLKLYYEDYKKSLR